MVSQELSPAFPVGASDLIDENDRNNPRFACLHQGEAFETFVHCSKSARKQSDGVGFFDEIHFPGKKIIKIYQSRVAVDRLVGSLLERQADVQPEAVLSPGSFLGGAHYSVPSPGDNHVSMFAHQTSKSFSTLVNFGARAGPRGTENRNLANSLIRGKNLGRLS